MRVAIGTLFLLYCNHRDGKHRSPTTRKEEITMKNSTPRIDRDKKTIYAALWDEYNTILALKDVQIRRNML